MKDKAFQAKIDLNPIENFKEKKLLINYSNITGLPNNNNKLFIKKELENYNKKLISSNINSSIIKNEQIIKKNLYQTLPKNEKIEYIHKIIKNSNRKNKDSFDSLEVQRKTYSLGYLIRQFDTIEKSKSFEENKICKIPYPLLSCLSNRKLENNSSNLLAKILTSENKKLSKRQEIEIKNSTYSKIFNANLNNLMKFKVRSNSALNYNNYNYLNNNSNIYEKDKFPFLNKYIKSKVATYNYNFFNRNQRLENYPNTTGVFLKEKSKKINLKKNIKSWNSTYINKKDKNKHKIKKEQVKNNIREFKNKTVCLYNYKNNIRNNSIINEKNYKIIEEIYYRKRKNQSQQRLIEIIKDISHLKFNNQIIPFCDK